MRIKGTQYLIQIILNRIKYCVPLILLAMTLSFNAFADETYNFNCQDSLVKGAIKYAVIGAYNFTFKHCQGTLRYDPKTDQINGVNVNINVRSLSSNCPWCDQIVLSKRLMNASIYPLIDYHGHQIEKNKVLGIINVHGVTKELKSDFELGQRSSPQYLNVQGQWVFRRRDYNLIWSKILDHGGVLVGENVYINWQVHAHKSGL